MNLLYCKLNRVGKYAKANELRNKARQLQRKADDKKYWCKMWYKKLGLYISPFNLDAKISSDVLLFNEKEVEDLLYYVKSGSMVLVKGPKHSGKTMLGMQVIENFKGKGKVIYLDLETYNKELDIGHILIGNQSFHRKFLNMYPRDMVLIVDNAITQDTDFYRRLQYFYDQGYLRSVVLIYKADELVEVPGSIISRVGSKQFNLKKISKEQILKVLEQRLKGLLFNHEHLDYIYSKSIDLEDYMANLNKIAEHFYTTHKKRMDINFIKRMI